MERLSKITRDLVEELGIDSDELSVVTGAIVHLANRRQGRPAGVSLAQFPASLRTLLEIAGAGMPAARDCEPFIHAIARFANESVKLLTDDDTPRPAVMPAPVEEVAAAEVATAPFGAWTAPARWEPIGDGLYRDCGWKDDERLQKRRFFKHVTITFHVAMMNNQPSFVCALAFGKEASQVTLRSNSHKNHEDALEEICEELLMCPDEPNLNWLVLLNTEIQKVRPGRSLIESVVMRNARSVGIPQYYCQARWFTEDQVTTSTVWQTMAAAFHALTARCVEELKRRHPTKAPSTPVAELSEKERMVAAGLAKPNIFYSNPGADEASARLEWSELDGTRLTTKKAAGTSRATAFENAFAEALACHAAHVMNWAAAAQLLLQHYPGNYQNLLCRFVPVESDAGLLHSCQLTWGSIRQYQVLGTASDDLASTLRSACAIIGAESEARKVAAIAQNSRDGYSKLQADPVMKFAKGMRSSWEDERSKLMALETRGKRQDERLSDLSCLLSLIEPSLRTATSMERGAALLHKLMASAQSLGSVDATSWNATSQARLLCALVGNSAPLAGMRLETSSRFVEVAATCGLSESQAIDELGFRRLINKKEDRLTLSDLGSKTVVKYGAPFIVAHKLSLPLPRQ